VRKIIEESRLGKLETMKRLTGLVLAGLVEPVKPAQPDIDTGNLQQAIDKLTRLLEKYQ